MSATSFRVENRSKKSADEDKLRIYLAECKRMGIRVLAPDVNKARRGCLPTRPVTAHDLLHGAPTHWVTSALSELSRYPRERANGAFTGDDLDQTMLRVMRRGVSRLQPWR